MSRSRITKRATLRRLSALVGFPVIGAFTRGGTDHRIDVWGIDYQITSIYRDGTIVRTDRRADDGSEHTS